MNPYIAVPAILALVYRAYSHNSLTPLGILTAFLTALIHAAHPSSLPFTLLSTFFLVGTFATKIHSARKSQLTLSSKGGGGGEGPRGSVQVLANSVCASLLILMDLYRIHATRAGTGGEWGKGGGGRGREGVGCVGGKEILIYGVIANYAAVAADTLSSELGILSPTSPRLITSLSLRKVPPGTNGGVTATGLGAGVLGAAIIAVVSVVMLPFCSLEGSATRKGGATMGKNGWPHSREAVGKMISMDDREAWTLKEKMSLFLAITAWGALGSLLDSLLGGWMQESVIDRKTGKVVEGTGGRSVLVAAGKGGKSEDGSRRIESGRGLLDNNGVNFLMAGIMSAGAVGVAGWWCGVDVNSVIR